MATTALRAECAQRAEAASAPASEPLDLLALLALPRVGTKTALRAALDGSQFKELVERHAEGWPEALSRAHRVLDDCRRQGIEVLGLFDERYPQRLRAIHDPPPLLFVKGSIDVLHDSRMVALVGTREPSSFGREATSRLASTLASGGWGIVSGLAVGVDARAHAAALEHGVPTVAVMAGGLDRIYPSENAGLAADIIDSGGALIAEVPPGVLPRRSHFVARDRLQSALAVAVVVAQTGVRGGTMHTVRYAAAQGRPVFCARPPSEHEQNAGLAVLLASPASELCNELPAWSGARSLCRRLGSQPLARGVSGTDLEDMLDGLEFALAMQQSPLEPPSSDAGEERFLDSHATACYDDPLFALTD